MKKICVLCQSWESGGIEGFLSQLFTYMDKFDMEIDFVVESLRESVFTHRLEEQGIHFVELSGSIRHPLRNTLMFSHLLRSRGYDVVHLNCYQGLSLVYLWIAKRQGVGIRIAHSHNTALRKSMWKPVKQALHSCAKWLFFDCATAHWACSSSAAQFMFPPHASYTYIPNGIDLSRFCYSEDTRRTVRESLDLETSFVVGHIGRMCYQKNQMFLLSVFETLCQIRPNSVLLLVGDGADRPLLEQRAVHLRIRDHVLFYGTTSKPEELYCAMDVFAFPSRFEGLGIVAIEAQCVGLPVLAGEEIPEEASATPLFHRLPLKAGAKAWAEALLEISCPHIRQDGVRAIETAGFSIHTVASIVSRTYKQAKETEKE